MLQASGGVLMAGGLLGPLTLAAQQDQSQPAGGMDLVFRTTSPNNAEPELAKLVKSWLTPTELFYVRSHAPNPVIDLNRFRLGVEGLVRRPLTLTLDELKRLPARTTTATLTCAGNRRAEFNGSGYENMPTVSGVLWEAGTIGNATWAGVLLADVLKQAEVTEDAKHVWFEGLDQVPEKGGVIAFGGSIPIEKAMMPAGTGAPLLAHTMNDAPLTPDHGFPVRMVVPGYIGARSVKWLGKIIVSDRPSPNHFVATAYKLVQKTDSLDWSESGPIYRYPVNAAICTPKPDTVVAAGKVELAGYALPSGRDGSQIKELLISADGGQTWTAGQLTGKNQDYCWQLWKASVDVNSSTREILLRATDSTGEFMPARAPWNAKGYLQNSWYRLPVDVMKK
jgi:sulfite oxidase